MTIKNLVKETLLVAAMTAALSGCTALHSDYERPELAEYVFANGAINTKADSTKVDDSTNVAPSVEALEPDFWVRFGDDKLTSLIEEVLKNGGSYQSALLTAQKALTQADITATNLIPDLNADIGSNLSKSFDGGSTRKSSSSSLRVSYELDLFGRLAAERKEQGYAAKASVNDAMAARMSVASEVASLYWKLVYTKDLLRLDEANLEASKRTYSIMENRFDAGKISKLELLQAERDLVEQQRALDTDKNTLKTTTAAINAMRNVTPDTEVATAETLLGLEAPQVSLSRGSELLGNRPDMRAAEDRLKSSLAAKDVAKLNMYPKLSLSAGISGGSTGELYQFFRDPLGSLAAALSFPFLNYYQNSLKIDVASLDYDSAEVKFISSYYFALSEVSQAENNRLLSDTMLGHDKKRLELALGTEEIYKARYAAGQVALKDYLEAQASRRTAEKSVVADIRESLDSTVVLVKALGGI